MQCIPKTKKPVPCYLIKIYIYGSVCCANSTGTIFGSFDLLYRQKVWDFHPLDNLYGICTHAEWHSWKIMMKFPAISWTGLCVFPPSHKSVGLFFHWLTIVIIIRGRQAATGCQVWQCNGGILLQGASVSNLHWSYADPLSEFADPDSLFKLNLIQLRIRIQIKA
jgi:hypothetical protein